MRVVGGRYRGKNLVTPLGLATRPTTDRVRENLFNILSNRIDFNGIRAMDLFAGTGALGIEALSRGAAFCLFVDNAGQARASIRKNVEALALTGNSKIFRRDATNLGPVEGMKPFDLVFTDPPYGRGLGEKTAQALAQGGWLSSNAIFILEEEKASMPETLDGFSPPDTRNYGDTAIGLFEYQD